MMTDSINGAIELAAAGMVLNHCRVLHADRSVRGVSVVSVLFFFSWGIWNLYFYPSLGQTLSFWGGVAVVMANGVYVGMLIYYRRGSAP